MSNDEDIAQFMAITGQARSITVQYLEMAGGSVDTAVSLFYDGAGGGGVGGGAAEDGAGGGAAGGGGGGSLDGMGGWGGMPPAFGGGAPALFNVDAATAPATAYEPVDNRPLCRNDSMGCTLTDTMHALSYRHPSREQAEGTDAFGGNSPAPTTKTSVEDVQVKPLLGAVGVTHTVSGGNGGGVGASTRSVPKENAVSTTGVGDSGVGAGASNPPGPAATKWINPSVEDAPATATAFGASGVTPTAAARSMDGNTTGNLKTDTHAAAAADRSTPRGLAAPPATGGGAGGAGGMWGGGGFGGEGGGSSWGADIDWNLKPTVDQATAAAPQTAIEERHLEAEATAQAAVNTKTNEQQEQLQLDYASEVSKKGANIGSGGGAKGAGAGAGAGGAAQATQEEAAANAAAVAADTTTHSTKRKSMTGFGGDGDRAAVSGGAAAGTVDTVDTASAEDASSKKARAGTVAKTVRSIPVRVPSALERTATMAVDTAVAAVAAVNPADDLAVVRAENNAIQKRIELAMVEISRNKKDSALKAARRLAAAMPRDATTAAAATAAAAAIEPMETRTAATAVETNSNACTN